MKLLAAAGCADDAPPEPPASRTLTAAPTQAAVRWQRLHLGEQLMQRATMSHDAHGNAVHACAREPQNAEPSKP